MTLFTWSKKTLTVAGISLEMPANITDVSRIGDLLVVILDSEEPSLMKSRFSNILAYSMTGEKIWEADLPSNHPADSYWSVTLGNPIRAMSFSSYKCSIDPSSGKIISAEFYK